MSVNHPLNQAVAFCLIVALSALVASSCASPTPQEGEAEEEVCEHRGWEGAGRKRSIVDNDTGQ